MTSKEALKRIRQETAPATYMADFDKNECCDIIEKDLEVLEIIKKYDLLSIIGSNNDYEKVKEWLKNEH